MTSNNLPSFARANPKSAPNVFTYFVHADVTLFAQYSPTQFPKLVPKIPVPTPAKEKEVIEGKIERLQKDLQEKEITTQLKK
jgi:hypothetical protein